MYSLWKANIHKNLELARNNAGPTLVTVVSGNQNDAEFWSHQLDLTRREVFRSDGRVKIVSALESVRKGNLLGTFNAWKSVEAQLAPADIPDIALMGMVFGQGRRFSPFTQAEGNRKSAFWTPLKTHDAGVYLSTGDISNLSTNIWAQTLREGGFRGLIVKWGDELIIPGVEWQKYDFRNIDAFRCVGKIEITESLAREKDWVVVDANTGLMQFQLMRQDIQALKKRLSALGGESYELRVNLGSLALTYEFLEAGLEVFGDDVLDSQKWADWDPYAWIALCCKDKAQWDAETAYEQRIGKSGIRNLESRYPDFYLKIREWRTALESRTGRPLAIGTLEFGDSFWVDLGLHLSLRQNFELLNTDSDRGKTIRFLFEIPEERDKNGNIILRSTVPDSADIRDSVIIDSVIHDRHSVIRQGQVIGGKHGTLLMPGGGTALFSVADHLEFAGGHGIAYKAIGQKLVLPEGGRYTTLLSSAGPIGMVSNESIIDYNGENYSTPILGNPISFEEAGKRMSKEEGSAINARWLEFWQNWKP
ncbi:MAG: hypothetical protein JXA21_05365 [Anaerolineae bacterium]|nr:hypothetical protein [Anaerolineae bacterium]